MKKKILAASLTAVLLMTACSQTNSTSVSMTEQTTTTTESTVTTTVETTTETTPGVTYSDDMLPMTIKEVADSITTAMGDDYYVMDDKDFWKKVIDGTDGVVDYMTCGRTSELSEKIKGHNYLYIVFEIYEFDMQSDAYKNILKTNTFKDKSGFDIEVTAINKQYVLVTFAALGNDLSISAEDMDAGEKKPPFTIGNTQAGYDAFIALK